MLKPLPFTNKKPNVNARYFNFPQHAKFLEIQVRKAKSNGLAMHCGFHVAELRNRKHIKIEKLKG